MKRPQGFDKTAAAARPAAPDERTAPGARSVGTLTDPRPPADAAAAAPAPASTPADLADDRDLLTGRVPSHREIAKALRDARRERRRIEKGEVRRFTKRSRRRKQGWLAAVGVVAALLLGVVLAAFSPLMAVKHIQIVGASRLDPAVIEAKLGNQLGKPLPLLDQAAISSDLAAFPLIRSYSVESHPPDTIVVRILERQPVGVIQKGPDFTLVDAAKVPISSSATRPPGYPIIAATGGSAETNADSGFAAAAAVLSALPADVLAKVDTISAHTKDDVSFTLRGTGATVVWGSAENSSLKAADLIALLKSAGSARHFDVSSPHSVTTG